MKSRRDFLTGQPFRPDDDGAAEAEPRAVPLDALPVNTIRLATTAMASDFEVILNPGPGGRLEAASESLDEIHRLEDQLSVYRPHSELCRLNAAATKPVVVESRLFQLLEQSLELAAETQGAFDPTSGRLVALWRHCRHDRRLPTASELESALSLVGHSHVILNPQNQSVAFDVPGVELNFNAMGKGYALDRAGEVMDAWFAERRPGAEGVSGDTSPEPISTANSWNGSAGFNPRRHSVSTNEPDSAESWLMHGGYSSLLARGSLAGADGWPIAIRHPHLPGRTLATVWLKNRGLSTSGAGVQFFRFQGKRYGHLIDPRTGWPVQGMLSTTVLAPTAAVAEALSTAFFVLGVETARAYCHNHPEVAAILVPAPEAGKSVECVVCGLSESELMFPVDH